jgi:hypothetical protein
MAEEPAAAAIRFYYYIILRLRTKKRKIKPYGGIVRRSKFDR